MTVPPDRSTSSGGAPADRLSPEQIEAYLDGLLSPDETVAVARSVETSAALKAQVELQHGIDRSIREQFCPPAEILLRLPEDAGPIPIAAAERAVGGRKPWTFRRGFLAAAAVLVISGMSLWMTGVVDPMGMMGFTPHGLVNPADVYVRKVATGFTPDWVCGDDEEFKDVTRKGLGQALLLAKAPGVEVVGWAYYDPVFSADTMLLFLKVDGKEVLWSIDRAENARAIKAPLGSEFHTKARVLGDLVIQETNTTGDFRAMDLAFNPDQDQAPCSQGPTR